MTAHTCPPMGTDNRYRGCLACRRNEDSWSVAGFAFCAVVFFTVAPLVPLMILALHSMFGPVGGWFGLGFFYAGVPLLAGAVSYLFPDRRQL